MACSIIRQTISANDLVFFSGIILRPVGIYAAVNIGNFISDWDQDRDKGRVQGSNHL